jgi:peptidoglycan hydrolase-like protein with peptidoglycan-binding domain
MSNASYTYTQVKQGNGSYKYESPTVYSAGVLTLQKRLNAIGYNLTENGKFDSGTQTAVKNFQTECNLGYDGVAGKNTLIQLDKVYQSSYFTNYGKPITSADWGSSKILEGNFDDVDLLARIIWCEERGITDAQYAVAKVIQNRSTTSGYYASSNDYPNASIWARVVGKKSQYDSANQPSCCTPIRGNSSRSDGIDIYWKKAVDLAVVLTSGSTLSVPKGYTIDSSGNVSSSKTTAVTSQLNQTASSQFKSNLNAGKVKGTSVTYTSTLTGNVFYTI